jgi:hypothetical protein
MHRSFCAPIFEIDANETVFSFLSVMVGETTNSPPDDQSIDAAPAKEKGCRMWYQAG